MDRAEPDASCVRRHPVEVANSVGVRSLPERDQVRAGKTHDISACPQATATRGPPKRRQSGGWPSRWCGCGPAWLCASQARWSPESRRAGSADCPEVAFIIVEPQVVLPGDDPLDARIRGDSEVGLSVLIGLRIRERERLANGLHRDAGGRFSIVSRDLDAHRARRLQHDPHGLVLVRFPDPARRNGRHLGFENADQQVVLAFRQHSGRSRCILRESQPEAAVGSAHCRAREIPNVADDLHARERLSIGVDSRALDVCLVLFTSICFRQSAACPNSAA